VEAPPAAKPLGRYAQCALKFVGKKPLKKYWQNIDFY
jgi:hypothetical protein